MKFEKTTHANELPTTIIVIKKFFAYYLVFLCKAKNEKKNGHEHALDNFFLQTDLLL